VCWDEQRSAEREQNAALKKEVEELKATLEKFKESSRFQVKYSMLS